MIIFSSLRLSFRAWVIILCVSSVSDILIQWGRKLCPSFIIAPLITPPKVSTEPLIGQSLSILATHWAKSNHSECALYQNHKHKGCTIEVQSLKNCQFNKYFQFIINRNLTCLQKAHLNASEASSLIFEN